MKSIPLLTETERQSLVRPVGSPHPRLIQRPVVVASKSLIEANGRLPVHRRSISQLVPSPVVNAHGYIQALINVERSAQSLRKHVDNIVVAVRPIVKFRAKRCLPLLRLHHSVGIGRMKNEPFETQFTQPRELRPGLEIRIGKITSAIRPL